MNPGLDLSESRSSLYEQINLESTPADSHSKTNGQMNGVVQVNGSNSKLQNGASKANGSALQNGTTTTTVVVNGTENAKSTNDKKKLFGKKEKQPMVGTLELVSAPRFAVQAL